MAHTSQEDLEQKLRDARKKIEVGALYTHYKTPDQKYIVEFVGILESSEEVCVGYRALYGDGILWVRTISNFLEEVERQNGPIYRFQKVT